MSSDSHSSPLLTVRSLRTIFHTTDGVVRAVDALDLDIHPGEIVGLVGESGSGKTVTALSILGLIQPPGEIEFGKIQFDGLDLRGLSEEAWSRIRGSRMALIFQDPKLRLNPVFTIGSQIAEIIDLHLGLGRKESWNRMLQLLEQVDLPDAEGRALSYPHELSVGQAQRVMIAMVLALEPELIIADEPTSSLDATIQAQILQLLKKQQLERGTAVVIISHNLAIMAQLAQRIVVLYAGHVVERASTEELIKSAHHPYTQGLLASLPQEQTPGDRLYSIPGRSPDARDLPAGCRFGPRCKAKDDYQLSICDQFMPELKDVGEGHQVRCWLYHGHGSYNPPLPGTPIETPKE